MFIQMMLYIHFRWQLGLLWRNMNVSNCTEHGYWELCTSFLNYIKNVVFSFFVFVKVGNFLSFLKLKIPNSIDLWPLLFMNTLNNGYQFETAILPEQFGIWRHLIVLIVEWKFRIYKNGVHKYEFSSQTSDKTRVNPKSTILV